MTNSLTNDDSTCLGVVIHIPAFPLSYDVVTAYLFAFLSRFPRVSQIDGPYTA